jgi:hypothetical protein
MIDRKDLERIIIRNGLPGKTTRTIDYLVNGSGAVTIQYSALERDGPDDGRPAMAHDEKEAAHRRSEEFGGRLHRPLRRNVNDTEARHVFRS